MCVCVQVLSWKTPIHTASSHLEMHPETHGTGKKVKAPLKWSSLICVWSWYGLEFNSYIDNWLTEQMCGTSGRDISVYHTNMTAPKSRRASDSTYHAPLLWRRSLIWGWAESSWSLRTRPRRKKSWRRLALPQCQPRARTPPAGLRPPGATALLESWCPHSGSVHNHPKEFKRVRAS